jgi:uncharacterized membrane protein
VTFVYFKFFHIAFMFLGTALAIGPASLVFLLARSADAPVIGRASAQAERIFQVSTACYGLGILFGVGAALTGALDLTAPWLLTAYALVAALGGHGIWFDRWTKRIARDHGSSGRSAVVVDHVRRERAPAYAVTAMIVLLVAIVFVMVTKLSFLSV